MKSEIPLPFNLKFEDWAEKFIANYPRLNLPYPKYRQDWSTWASLLLNFNEFKGFPTPLKSIFKDDWQRWAILAISTLRKT